MKDSPSDQDSGDFDLLPEELIYILLHELIDDIFGGSPRHDDDDDERPPSSPPPTSPPLVSPCGHVSASDSASAAKRRRLGVNPGAHEQIVKLQATLLYVTEERDFWRNKCRDLQAGIECVARREERLQRQVGVQEQVIGFYRSKKKQHQEPTVAKAIVKKVMPVVVEMEVEQ